MPAKREAYTLQLLYCKTDHNLLWYVKWHWSLSLQQSASDLSVGDVYLHSWDIPGGEVHWHRPSPHTHTHTHTHIYIYITAGYGQQYWTFRCTGKVRPLNIFPQLATDKRLMRNSDESTSAIINARAQIEKIMNPFHIPVLFSDNDPR